MGKGRAIQGATVMEKLFAYEYFNNKGDGTNAAISAGYSKKTAAQQATRLLKRVQVKKILEELNGKLENRAIVSKERLLAELEAIALFDLRSIYDENGALLPIKQLSQSAGAAISGIEIMEEFDGTGKDRVHIGNTVKIKTSSKISAIDTYMDTMGWKAPKKVANTYPNGEAVQPFSDDQVDKLINSLRDKKAQAS